MGAEKIITVRCGGERFSAVWSLTHRRLQVSSAYGAAQIRLANEADAELTAKAVFLVMVEDWLDGCGSLPN